MLQESADQILQTPMRVKITENKKHWFTRKTITKEHNFEIKPLFLGTLIKISKIILTIDENFFKSESVHELSLIILSKVGRDISKIVALAFLNSKDDPSEKLIDLIENNITPEQLLAIFQVILKQMDTGNFISSIIYIRQTNLMKMNPTTQRSSIAFGEQSEA
jgi:hypothetical protein